MGRMRRRLLYMRRDRNSGDRLLRGRNGDRRRGGFGFALDLGARRRSGGALPGKVRDAFRLQNRRHGRRLRSGLRSFITNQSHDGVALLRIQRAELIFHVEAVLTTQVEQFLALHVQFVRQMINANLLVLQAEIPVLTRCRARQSGLLLDVLFILTDKAWKKKRIFSV